MAEHEAIFKGSAADFVRFVDDFESRRDFNSSTVFHLPRYLPESSRGFVHIYPPDSDGEGMIEAYSLPGERSILVCRTHEDTWSEIEPYWRDLLAELQRLGLIEDGQDKTAPTEAADRSGIGPSLPQINYRAEWVYKLQNSGLSAELFVVSEAGQKFGHGPQMLRRYAKQPEVLAYIEANFHHSASSQ